MTPKAKTPDAIGAESGGDRAVLAGAERADHTPPPGSVTRPSYLVQDLWMVQVAGDPSQINAAFRAAWAVSTFLRRHGAYGAASTLRALDAIAAPARTSDASGKSLRQGLLSLERAGHLWIDRSAGRGPGRAHRYALILRKDLV